MTQEDQRKSYDGPSLYADGTLGLFTVIAVILLVWGFCWFKSYSSLRVPQKVSVLFKEVAGLNVNAAVYVDGVRVGIVDSLHWQGEHKVLVRIRINAPEISVPQGSKFVILTNGIVGAKYVEIQFPDREEGAPPVPPISEDAVVLGEDPVRPEIAVNNIAIGLSKIDMEQLSHNFEADRARLVLAADQLAILGKKTMPVVDKALPLADELLGLTREIGKLTGRTNKFLDNPKLPSDLKETAEKARETMDSAQKVVHEVSTTLKDASLRKDLLSTVDKLSKAAESVQNSVERIERLAGDRELRGDLKDMLAQAKNTLSKVDDVLNTPGFKGDLKKTLIQAKDAVEHADLAARQLNQILNQRFPLVKMMIGRPGYIEGEKEK